MKKIILYKVIYNDLASKITQIRSDDDLDNEKKNGWFQNPNDAISFSAKPDKEKKSKSIEKEK